MSNTECFGKFWDGAEGEACNTSPSKRCLLLEECLQLFIGKRLPKYRADLGWSSDTKTLSVIAGISENSMREAIRRAVEGGKWETAPLDVVRKKRERKKRENDLRDAKGKWAHKHDHKRFLREREKNQYVAKLAPGMILRTKYRRKEYEVFVRSDHYEMDGKRYPTLSSVVIAITGLRKCLKQKRPDGTRPDGYRMMAPYDSIRLFRLKERFE